MTLFLSVTLSVFPHGTVTYPPSRIWNCFQEGPESPDSAPCIAAVASHGTQALYDWNEINQANVNGNHRQYIMDGNLASGGRPEKYGGMDQVRPDWVSTLVSPGPLTVTWTNHAPHATAYYEVYITKESWSPDQPLTWDSLVLLVRTPPSGPERIVNIPVTLPVRTGKHVIYSIWQRSDSGEAFYSASDIHFDGGGSDTQAPSTPTGLGASNTTQTTADLSWNAATDNVGVTGYDIYQGDTVIASVNDTSYQITGLTANTSYPFRVKAKDAANNQSGFSNTITVTTLDTGGGSDTQAPSIPTNLGTSNTTQTTIDLSWNAATDNVGVTGYDIYQENTFITTVNSTSYQVTGLTQNTSYSFRVKAKDAAGNQSDFSNIATTTTLPDIGGGNCAGIPQYAVGTSYSQGEEIQNAGGKYTCNIPGWCSSIGAWAYAPGTGVYWQHAWSKTGDCNSKTLYSLFPTVTKDVVSLMMKAESTSLIKINLYDFTGKLMNSQTYQGNQKSITQDLSKLKEGLYIFRIYIDGKVYTERIIKK
ncbi:lytic polysaccharide monooxygenase [Aquimarina muelleri]|uniref:lytic polysaccharide monooxygenase n=1 Tax=Aquimarina muelleri TaxID=279356 RepID=UPI003F6867BE